MSNTATLRFTTTYDGAFFQIEAEIVAGTLPRAVFIYRNHGEQENLTDFQSVGTVETLSKAKLWAAGPDQPTFGVPYLKWTSARKAFETSDECEAWKILMTRDVKSLIDQLDNLQPQVDEVIL